MSDALDVLRFAVADGLPGSHHGRRNADHPPALSREVIGLAARHRVQGLLWSAIEAGEVSATEQLVQAAREDYSAALRTCLVAEEAAVLALDALTRAGVETRVLKGVAIAHLDHPGPDERVFGDADVLVRRSDHHHALGALTAAGFRRAEPPVRGWWERRFGKSIVLDAPPGGELDLHLAITGGYFGERIDHDRLWTSRRDTFEVAGLAAVGLDPEGRLLQACCHAVLGGGSGLRTRRDVAQLVLITGADWQIVTERATEDGADLVIAEAVRATWSELDLDPDHGLARWAHRAVDDPVQQRALAGYASALQEGWAPEGRTMLAALGPVDRLRFLAGLAFPSRESIRHRHRTRHGQPPIRYPPTPEKLVRLNHSPRLRRRVTSRAAANRQRLAIVKTTQAASGSCDVRVRRITGRRCRRRSPEIRPQW